MHRTEIVRLASGHESRIARWSRSLRRYEAGYGVRSRADIDAVIAFFEGREGRRYAFRFRDPVDHSSANGGARPTPYDQVIGTGDGVQTIFFLTKSYDSGPVSQSRPITLPVAESVGVAVAGAEMSEGADFTVDPLTGTVTFGAAPALGQEVRAGFLFDIPARFDTDALMIEPRPGAADIPDIPIVEVRF